MFLKQYSAPFWTLCYKFVAEDDRELEVLRNIFAFTFLAPAGRDVYATDFVHNMPNKSEPYLEYLVKFNC